GQLTVSTAVRQQKARKIASIDIASHRETIFAPNQTAEVGVDPAGQPGDRARHAGGLLPIGIRIRLSATKALAGHTVLSTSWPDSCPRALVPWDHPVILFAAAPPIVERGAPARCTPHSNVHPRRRSQQEDGRIKSGHDVGEDVCLHPYPYPDAYGDCSLWRGTMISTSA